jgi:hypothetical protein
MLTSLSWQPFSTDGAAAGAGAEAQAACLPFDAAALSGLDAQAAAGGPPALQIPGLPHFAAISAGALDLQLGGGGGFGAPPGLLEPGSFHEGASGGERERPAQTAGAASSKPRGAEKQQQAPLAARAKAAAAAAAPAATAATAAAAFRSDFRGVSYDKKKRKWRVQIKVSALGKSGVSVGYFETEAAAARAYDRAAIGLLGRASCRTILNFSMEEYENDNIPVLVGEWCGRF